MKAESRLTFVYESDTEEPLLVDEAKCPKCRLWMEVNSRQAIGKFRMKCTICGWMGYVGREGIIK